MMHIYCVGSAGSVAPGPKPVAITIAVANTSLAIFSLYREGDPVKVARDRGDAVGPSDLAHWMTTDPGSQQYTLHVFPANQAGGTTDTAISITQDGNVLPATDEHHNVLAQPIKFAHLPNGVDSLAVIWVNLL